jgi:hypothetical protein
MAVKTALAIPNRRLITAPGNDDRNDRRTTTAARRDDACRAIGCSRVDDVAPVTRADRGTRVLCRPHRREFMGVSS